MHIGTDIQTVKRVNLYLGAAALAVGCLMTMEFGRSMSWLHAASLCLLTVAAALLPAYVHHLWSDNAKPTAAMLGAVAVLFVGTEYFSHLGYTIGHRVRDTEETTVQNVAHDNAQAVLADERANIGMWRKQLADLTAQNAWATTVSPDGLKAQLGAAQKDIDLETQRGGCKQKCQKLMVAKADLENRIAVASQAIDLGKKIEATQRIIDSKTTTAATTEHKSSKVVSQTKFVSQLATMELEPGKAALTWAQIAIGALIALVTTFLAPVCFFVAFRDRVAGAKPQSVGFASPANDDTRGLFRREYIARMAAA